MSEQAMPVRFTCAHPLWTTLLTVALAGALISNISAQVVTIPGSSARPVRFDAARLNSYSDDDLIRLVAGASRQFNWDVGIRFDYTREVVDELVRRKPIPALLRAFQNPADIVQLESTERVLSRIGTPIVDSALRLDARPDSSERAFFALKYFAERGRCWALDSLSHSWRQYAVSSADWASIVDLIGKYRFYPAAPQLVATIDVASVTLGNAAQEALAKLFSNASPGLLPPDQASAYWSDYVRKAPLPDLSNARCY